MSNILLFLYKMQNALKKVKAEREEGVTNRGAATDQYLFLDTAIGQVKECTEGDKVKDNNEVQKLKGFCGKSCG